MSTLPNGWVPVTIAAISESIQYGHTASAVERETGPRFLRITDIQDGQVDWSTVPSCNLTKDELPKYQLKPGDLVFARTGATTGKSFLIRHCPDAVFASYLIRVRVSSEMDERFLALFFQSPDYWRQIEGGKRGVGQPNVNGTILGKVQFFLPPLAEQRRIVGKVEELFSELDEGVANLKQARAQLAVYRQALLKHAFEGHLTADWRSKHAPDLESADQLLARIRAEREERYQKQLKDWEKAIEKWEADGCTEKKPSKPTKPAFGVSKVEPDKMLPKGWAKLELEYLAVELVLGKMLDKAKNIGKPRPYLGNINVRWGTFELENLKEMRIEDSEVSRYRVEPGDLVVCEGGEPGRCAIWKAADTEVFIQKALHRVRFTDSFDSRFAYLYLTLAASTQQLEEYFTGTTIKHLTGAGLAKTAFPLCSIGEQREIISKLEAQISAIDVVEADIDLNLQKAEALRQSILKKAFAGELVPQDPADEPAAALLARIRAEREAQPVNRRTR